MASVYDIHTAIHLRNMVSPAILKIIGEIGVLQGKIGELNKSFLALGGALGVAGGVGIFAGLKYAVDKAKDLNHELVQIQKLGLNPTQYGQAQAAIYGLHAQVPGMTSTDASKLYGASYSALGHENAMKIMKAEAEFVQVLGAQTGDYKGAVDKIYNMVRAGDLMGKFMDSMTHQVDVDKLQHFFDLGARVITATHGRVNADTWLALAQQGGPAMSGMSDEGLLTMAMVAQGMGGHRAGTALSSIYQQLIGGTMTEYRAKQFKAMGIVGDYTVGKGGKIVWPEGSLDTPATRALKENPIEFVKILQQKLVERGLTTIDQQVPELYKLFQRQTSTREIHDMLRNMPQMEQERMRIKGGLGISTASSLQNTKDYTQALHNFTAAWDEFMTHIGSPVLENIAIPALKSMTKALDGFMEWAKKNPGAIEVVSKGLAALGAALIVVGSAAVIAAMAAWIPGGVIVTAIAAVIASIGTLAAIHWDSITAGFTTVKDAITGFATWLHGIGQGISDWITSLGGLLHRESFGGAGIGGGGGRLIRTSLGGAGGGFGPGAPTAGRHIGGLVNVNGSTYHFGSGGGSHAHIPYGDYPITPGAIGPWGAAHGALGLNDNAIWDATLGRMRRGIEIHPGHDALYTAGCLAIAKGEYPRFKAQVQDMIRTTGGATLHVGPRGASVTPHRSRVRGEQMVQVHHHYLDGRQIASNTVTHVLKGSEHSRQSAYFDGYHSFAGADRQTATA